MKAYIKDNLVLVKTNNKKKTIARIIVNYTQKNPYIAEIFGNATQAYSVRDLAWLKIITELNKFGIIVKYKEDKNVDARLN